MEEIAKILFAVHCYKCSSINNTEDSDLLWVELIEKSDNKEEIDKKFFADMATFVILNTTNSYNPMENLAIILSRIHSKKLWQFYYENEPKCQHDTEEWGGYFWHQLKETPAIGKVSKTHFRNIAVEILNKYPLVRPEYMRPNPASDTPTPDGGSL